MTRRFASALALAALLAVSACASTYGPDSLTGGFSETALSADSWRVRFGGNGYTTQETVQTYWLYHCAELTLAKGYDGFAIATQVNLSALHDLIGDRQSGFVQVHSGGGGGVHVTTFAYSYTSAYKPAMTGQIRMLKRPFVAIPGHVFDATALKTFLAPYVTGPKCDGNVCPHVHAYLYPPAS